MVKENVFRSMENLPIRLWKMISSFEKRKSFSRSYESVIFCCASFLTHLPFLPSFSRNLGFFLSHPPPPSTSTVSSGRASLHPEMLDLCPHEALGFLPPPPPLTPTISSGRAGDAGSLPSRSRVSDLVLLLLQCRWLAAAERPPHPAVLHYQIWWARGSPKLDETLASLGEIDRALSSPNLHSQFIYAHWLAHSPSLRKEGALWVSLGCTCQVHSGSFTLFVEINEQTSVYWNDFVGTNTPFFSSEMHHSQQVCPSFAIVLSI